ncbi:Phage protein [Streptococcus mitis]|uniref:Phage protein n=1 Tax=Streptococcus mitis TaxID=28037 RepID=A0A139PKH2_STRMT|nr:Phage protein [Streptococcus mitis]
MEDIVPSLLKKIKSEFEGARLDSEVLKDLLSKLHHSKASYLDANQYAIEIGEILSKALGASLTNETLPDGKMYYNIAQRVLTDVLGRNYELVSDYAEQVQKNLNSEAKIGLAAQVPELNQDRIDGLVNRLASEESFDDVRWLLEEPVVNFTQSIIDDSIQKNAEFHHKSGLQPEIVRKAAYHCCEWCQEVQGTYKYPRVPKDIYRRHKRCKCTVDYDPKSGKVQNVWSKAWSKSDKSDKIETRKSIGIQSEISQVRKLALQIGITSNPIKKSSKKLTEEEIIQAISGGDKTKGSCSSAAFAYIGNKGGYTVLDFRGGESCDFFSRNSRISMIGNLPGVKMYVAKNTNDFKATKELLENVENGNEYYLATGRHAAIIRKNDNLVEYLELQSKIVNGFKPFDDTVLKKRFKAQKSHAVRGRKYDVDSYLIDVNSLKDNPEFHNILSFLNTAESKQMKGIEGHEK